MLKNMENSRDKQETDALCGRGFLYQAGGHMTRRQTGIRDRDARERESLLSLLSEEFSESRRHFDYFPFLVVEKRNAGLGPCHFFSRLRLSHEVHEITTGCPEVGHCDLDLKPITVE